MSDFEKIKGKWKHSAEWDSDDYRAIYLISGTANDPKVYAKDLSDSEEFIISDVSFNNGVLEFIPVVPSTKRRGLNKFKLNPRGGLESEFTFTVIEQLERDAT